MMLMQCEFFNSPPKAIKTPKERKAHPPILEIFIVLNEKDNEKYQGEGSANDSKGKGGRWKKKDTLFFFLKANKSLGCLPRSACLRSVARPLPPNSWQWRLRRCTGEGVEKCSGIQDFPSVSKRNPIAGRDWGRSSIPGRPRVRSLMNPYFDHFLPPYEPHFSSFQC